jgi:hypothetical protein
MRGKLTVLLMMVAASTAGAKTQEPTADEQTQEHPAESRRPLRVLENPYDISSFYRSNQSGGGFYGPIDLLRRPAMPYGGRYPIAGFYRSNQGYYFGLQTPVSRNPYAIASYYRSSASNDVRFWHGGYGRPAPKGRPGGYSQYWNSIGENGDVFLLAPTILAPVGALSAIYYSGR